MLANTFQTFDALKNADIEALKKTPDVGDITAEWIVDFFKHRITLKYLIVYWLQVFIGMHRLHQRVNH
jgi:DNA ligase (NAD+)